MQRYELTNPQASFSIVLYINEFVKNFLDRSLIKHYHKLTLFLKRIDQWQKLRVFALHRLPPNRASLNNLDLMAVRGRR